MVDVRGRLNSSARGMRALVAGAILVFAFLLFPPWHPAAMTEGLDPSFRYALNELYARGAQFGTEVIYQYGPYGFLLSDEYHPHTYSQLLLARVFFALVLVGLTLALASRFLTHVWAWGPWSCVLIGALAWYDMPYMLLPHLALLVDIYGEGKRRLVLLALATPAMALASLIKFAYLLMAVAVLGVAVVAGLVDFWRDRPQTGLARAQHLLRSCVWPAGYVFSLVGFWQLADQHLANLLPFLRASWHLASTYGVCHAMSGPPWELAWFVLLGGSFWLLATAAELRRRGWAGVPVVLALALYFFMSGKHGFVRHDPPHAVIGAFYASCGVWLYGLVVIAADWRANRRASASQLRPLAVLGVMFATLGYASLLLTTYRWPAGSWAIYFQQRAASLPSQLRGVRAWLANPDWFAGSAQDAMARLRQQYPLPELAGTVDLYPFNLSILFAQGFKYQPRPLLQSFQACDPWLAEKNAAAIEWPHGPDHILFEIWPIDGHLAATEDSLSWPHLLAGYQPQQQAGALLVLARAAQPARIERRLLRAQKVAWNTWLPLEPSADGLLWAEIDLQRSPAGSLLALLFREPRIYISVQLASGKERIFRLFPQIGRTGFLLSPIVETVDEFARLYAQGPLAELRDQQVVACRIRLDKTWTYQPEIEFRLFALAIERSGVTSPVRPPVALTISSRMSSSPIAIDHPG